MPNGSSSFDTGSVTRRSPSSAIGSSPSRENINGKCSASVTEGRPSGRASWSGSRFVPIVPESTPNGAMSSSSCSAPAHVPLRSRSTMVGRQTGADRPCRCQRCRQRSIRGAGWPWPRPPVRRRPPPGPRRWRRPVDRRPAGRRWRPARYRGTDRRSASRRDGRRPDGAERGRRRVLQDHDPGRGARATGQERAGDLEDRFVGGHHVVAGGNGGVGADPDVRRGHRQRFGQQGQAG